MRRSILSFAAGLVAAALGIGVASAHVGVIPQQVPPDSNQVFTIRVPNEKEEPTVEVRVEFPVELTVSRFQPKPGWTYEIERDATGKIVGVTWSGGAIGVGEYDEFALIGRTPKEPGALTFKAYQTYQSGETVEWIQPEGEQQPAPIVEVRAAPAASEAAGSMRIEGTGHDSATSGGQDEASALPNSDAGGVAPSAPTVALGISIAALLCSIVAVILAGLGLRRRAS